MEERGSVYFATGNEHKFNEVGTALQRFGIRTLWFRVDLEEPQSDDLEYISRTKAARAYSIKEEPVVADDTGLFIKDLGGFPGPYTAYISRTIGMDGIQKLIKKNREAVFTSVVTYYDGRDYHTFRGDIPGIIGRKKQGKGWGFDTYFIPHEQPEKIDGVSDHNPHASLHRYRALEKLGRWLAKEWQ